MNNVHFVLPAGVDDPAQPSGGNTYDSRVRAGLAAAGWRVAQRPAPGRWPVPDEHDRHQLARSLSSMPDGSVILVDGLIGSAAPSELSGEAGRLRIVLLVHMPLGSDPGATRDREAIALRAATAVVATSGWTRDRLLEWYALPEDRVHVAHPGVDPAALAAGTPAGTELLCVGAVAPHKGHDVLVEALAALAELPWRCRFVGPLDRDRAFVERLQASIGAHRLADRIEFAGPNTGPDLDRCYARADLLVSASQGETYGMALAEALARGLPVVSTDVGGVREALGSEPVGLPGLLVPPGEPAPLAAALRRWLVDSELRTRLRESAAVRRSTLPSWAETTDRVAAALVAAATPDR